MAGGGLEGRISISTLPAAGRNSPGAKRQGLSDIGLEMCRRLRRRDGVAAADSIKGECRERRSLPIFPADITENDLLCIPFPSSSGKQNDTQEGRQ